MREACKFRRSQEQSRKLERRLESVILNVRDILEILSAEDSVDFVTEVADSRI